MTRELFLMAFAALVSLVVVLLSPVVRAICWDAFVHPRFCCYWARDGKRLREVKPGIDLPAER